MTRINNLPARTVSRKSGYHHGDLRKAIIDAVSQLIDERRSLDFHLKDVAELVGTSQPAIYRHFNGKQALLTETALEGYDYQAAFRNWAIEQAPASPLAKLMAVGYAYVHFAQTCPGLFMLMKNFETEEILSSERYQIQRMTSINAARSLAKECIDSKLFIDMDLDTLMASLQATVFGIAHLYVGHQLSYVAHSRQNDKDLVARLLAIHIGSLLTPKGRRHMAAASLNPFASAAPDPERRITRRPR